MASTTKTSTAAAAGVQPALLHAGVTCVTTRYVLSLASISDVVLFQKVPNHVTVVDGYVSIDGTFSGTTDVLGISVGIGDDTPFFLSSASFSSAALLHRFNRNLPHRVSLSDSASPQFQYLKAVVGSTLSNTMTLYVTASWIKDA